MNTVTTFENYSNSMYDYDKEKRKSQSIFVSIVSYRDPNIINTLNSLIMNAKNGENITVSIAVAVYKNPEKWFLELEKFINEVKNKTRITFILKVEEAFEVNHLGHLKNISHLSYNKEDFYLSVSSSSEFDPHWDDILIKQYNSIYSLEKNNNFVLTCNPRGFIPHDNIVPGYVFFTNHKSNSSFQREEYDGARVIISGYNKFIEESNFLPGKGLYSSEDITRDYKKTIEAEEFLKNYNFVIFNDRKFLKNEYIAQSFGISDKFIFCDAKQYFKINKIEDYVISSEDFNFISYINFMKNNFSVLSVRWTPVYHLYDDNPLSIKRPSTIENYDDKDINESLSYKKIKQSILSLLDSDDVHMIYSINTSLAVDWNEKTFKKNNSFSANDMMNSINSFISFYNFSTNENSLHWNNRLLNEKN